MSHVEMPAKPLTPQESDYLRPISDHLLLHFCNNEQLLADYLTNWLAFPLQQLGEKTGVAKLLVNLDEATFGGLKRENQILKNFITEPRATLTEKFKDNDPGFCLDRFLVAASRWVLPKRLPSGRSGRGVRPTAVCVGASTAGGDTGLFSSIHSWGIFNEDLSSQMAPARLHAGIHRRRAAGLNADDDATP
ncbi:g2557 [Coccomyxa elongata]